MNVSYTPEDFVATLADQVPDRYHTRFATSGYWRLPQEPKPRLVIFKLLGQQKRARPRRLGWAFSRRRDFGVDPLIDRRGKPMHWVGRLKARVG